MVDRYFLPVPKSVVLGFHISQSSKKTRKVFRLYLLGAFLVGFQINRVLAMKVTTNKTQGYFLDWDSPDAPKKLRYY